MKKTKTISLTGDNNDFIKGSRFQLSKFVTDILQDKQSIDSFKKKNVKSGVSLDSKISKTIDFNLSGYINQHLNSVKFNDILINKYSRNTYNYEKTIAEKRRKRQREYYKKCKVIKNQQS